MTLEAEAKTIIEKMFGKQVAEQIKNFDDPKKYPKDFIDQCVYFTGKLVGVENARKKFEQLYKKYAK